MTSLPLLRVPWVNWIQHLHEIAGSNPDWSVWKNKTCFARVYAAENELNIMQIVGIFPFSSSFLPFSSSFLLFFSPLSSPFSPLLPHLTCTSVPQLLQQLATVRPGKCWTMLNRYAIWFDKCWADTLSDMRNVEECWAETQSEAGIVGEGLSQSELWSATYFIQSSQRILPSPTNLTNQGEEFEAILRFTACGSGRLKADYMVDNLSFLMVSIYYLHINCMYYIS